MALNFPINPSIGDSHVVGLKTYKWSGAAWLISTEIQTVTSSEVTSPVNSVSTDSGALQVVGGVGIGGDLWIGGTVFSNSQPVITTATLKAEVFGGNDIIIYSTGTTEASFLRFDNVSTLQSVTNRGNTTTNALICFNQTSSTSTITGALVVAGGVGIGGRVTCESLRITDSKFDTTRVTVSTTATVRIDSFLSSEYRSAKYFVQVSSGGGAGHADATAVFQAQEIVLIIDNSGQVYYTEYGLIGTGINNRLGTFSADVITETNTVELYYSPTAATEKTIKVLRTSITS